MLQHFAENKDAKYSYKLYGHYKSGEDSISLPLTVEYIKQKFFTYTEAKKRHIFHEELGLSDDELENTYLKDISIVNREIPNAEDLEFVEVEELIIHKIFEKQVEQHGDEVILTASDGEFTYNEINENANSIANALIKRGVEIEDKVMFILRK